MYTSTAQYSPVWWYFVTQDQTEPAQWRLLCPLLSCCTVAFLAGGYEPPSSNPEITATGHRSYPSTELTLEFRSHSLMKRKFRGHKSKFEMVLISIRNVARSCFWRDRFYFTSNQNISFFGPVAQYVNFTLSLLSCRPCLWRYSSFWSPAGWFTGTHHCFSITAMTGGF